MCLTFFFLIVVDDIDDDVDIAKGGNIMTRADEVDVDLY